MLKKIQSTLIEQLDKAINKGEKPKFVEVPCELPYMTPSVLKAITLMVNTGKMVPITKSLANERLDKDAKTKGEKPIAQILFRGLKQDEDGDDEPETLRGEVILFCGTEKDFAEASKWIADNPYEDPGESPDEMLQGEGYPGDLWGIAGGTLPVFDFEEDGALNDASLKKYAVDSHEYVCPPDADEACEYVLAYVFCKDA